MTERRHKIGEYELSLDEDFNFIVDDGGDNVTIPWGVMVEFAGIVTRWEMYSNERFVEKDGKVTKIRVFDG
jgi:hypothetical protein